MMQRDRDLERELGELGAHIEYPPTPDLASAVRSRLNEGEEPEPHRFRLSLPAPRWMVVAAASLVIIAVPVLSPALRETAAGWFEGGQASSGEQAAGGAGQEGSSPGSPESKSTPMAAQGGSRADVARPASGGRTKPGSGGGSQPSHESLGYGDRITLRDARTRLAGSELLLPERPGLGVPDEVYAGGSSRSDGVVFVYRAGSELPSLGDTRVGLVLTEVPGSVESAYLRGGAPAAAGIERWSVGGRRGYWVPASRRPLSLAKRTGDLPGNLLLWEQGGLALGLAADLPKQEMIRIAGSVR